LTGAIAHEINQPLGAILSNADAADLPDQDVQTVVPALSLWYRRKLPRTGLLEGLWLMGGAGYAWTYADIAPTDPNDEALVEGDEALVARARGPIFGVGIMWMSNDSVFPNTTGSSWGIEYRYTWSELSTTSYNTRWFETPPHMSITGHTLVVRLSSMIGL